MPERKRPSGGGCLGERETRERDAVFREQAARLGAAHHPARHGVRAARREGDGVVVGHPFRHADQDLVLVEHRRAGDVCLDHAVPGGAAVTQPRRPVAERDEAVGRGVVQTVGEEIRHVGGDGDVRGPELERRGVARPEDARAEVEVAGVVAARQDRLAAGERDVAAPRDRRVRAAGGVAVVLVERPAVRKARAGRVEAEDARAVDDELALQAGRQDRLELAFHARRRAAEDRDRHPGRGARKINQNRPGAAGERERRRRERAAHRRLQGGPALDFERGGAAHRRRPFERRAGLDDDRIRRRRRRARERERRAGAHGRRSVAGAVRERHRQLALLDVRAARVLLLAAPHDHLARALLHDLGGTFADVGIERNGVASGVDRERVAVRLQAPVAVLLAVQSTGGRVRLMDREVVRRRERAVAVDRPHVVAAQHAESAGADDEVREVLRHGAAT